MGGGMGVFWIKKGGTTQSSACPHPPPHLTPVMQKKSNLALKAALSFICIFPIIHSQLSPPEAQNIEMHPR